MSGPAVEHGDGSSRPAGAAQGCSPSSLAINGQSHQETPPRNAVEADTLAVFTGPIEPLDTRRRSTLCWLLLALFTLGPLLVNDSYYRNNRRIPTYDEAWYLETSLRLYHRLAEHNLGSFVYNYRTAFETKAPLIALLPLPFYAVLGPSHHSALLANSLLLAIANLFLFLVARRLFSAGVGLAAVLFFQTMPLACGLSRTVLTEYGLSALVLAWVYCLIASDGLSHGSANFAMGVVLGLGLLMKIIFPIFVVGPFLLAVFWRRRSAAKPPALSSWWLWRLCAQHPLLAILLPAAAIASTWYAFNLRHILRFAWDNAFGQIGAGYASLGQLPRFVVFINEGVSCYYAAALLATGIMALLVQRAKAHSDALLFSRPTLLLISWVAPPLFLIALSSNREIRFAAPVLPAFAIVLAVSAFRSGRAPVVRILLVTLLLIFPLRLYAALSFHPAGYGEAKPVLLGPFVLFSGSLGLAHYPDAEGQWGQERIVGAIHSLDRAGHLPHLVAVGIEHPYLNANLLSYLNAYPDYNLRFTSLGYAETSAERAAARLRTLDARFLVMGEGFEERELTPFLNQLNAEFQRRLDQGKLPFHLRLKVPLYRHVQAAIYQRDAE